MRPGIASDCLHNITYLPSACARVSSRRLRSFSLLSAPNAPRAVTARHDGIVQLLAAIFRRAGALVNIEVKCDDENRVRPDLEIILSDRSILADVAVVHPAAPSRKRLTPLSATRDIENAKATKYLSIASERGARFLAFIPESYGAFGKQAMDLLKLLDNTLDHAPARPSELSIRAVIEAIAVTLQRGNAFISHSGSLMARAQAAAS